MWVWPPTRKRGPEIRMTLSRPIRIGVSALPALLVPIVTFWLIAVLNDRDIDREELQQSVVNFDVEKHRKIQKQKPQPPKKTQRKPRPDNTPSLKPSLNNDALALSGLSFGVPQFDETNFKGLGDQSLLDDPSQTKKADSLDTRPKVVKRSPLVYPELARKQGISGFVVMNVLINEFGDVENVVIVDSKPEEIFDLKADSAIRQWKFEPATYNGRKVKAWALQKIAFKLQ